MAERVCTAGFGDSGFAGVVGCADLCERFEDVLVVYGPALPLLFAFLTLDFGIVKGSGEIFSFDLWYHRLCLTRRGRTETLFDTGVKKEVSKLTASILRSRETSRAQKEEVVLYRLHLVHPRVEEVGSSRIVEQVSNG